MKGEQAWKIADLWVSAWNAHDLNAIMSRYDDDMELTSPVAARLLGAPNGKVIGKKNLNAYFRKGGKLTRNCTPNCRRCFVDCTA